MIVLDLVVIRLIGGLHGHGGVVTSNATSSNNFLLTLVLGLAALSGPAGLLCHVPTSRRVCLCRTWPGYTASGTIVKCCWPIPGSGPPSHLGEPTAPRRAVRQPIATTGG
jgi:hypothetical protein